MDLLPTSEASNMPLGTSPEQPLLARKPSLLPAFEPLSPSPITRPRSSKRKYEDESPSRPKIDLKYYPTPVPTSSTGILPSSPARTTRPTLQRTASTLSQRAALTAMPSVDLPADGTVVRMGRSSNSSDYQLSVNRLISRVHIEASYQAPTSKHSHSSGKVLIVCLGENGARIHSGGRAYHLTKGGSFSSDNPLHEIMLDVQDARVLVVWPHIPRQVSIPLQSDSTWNINDSPSRRLASSPTDAFASSPPRLLGSPISPSPGQHNLGLDLASQNIIQVYEDVESGEDVAKSTEEMPLTSEQASRSHSNSTDDLRGAAQSQSHAPPPADLSDCDEENDPIIHSFGPFGDNVLGRMASFSTDSHLPVSPQNRRHLKSQHSPVNTQASETKRSLNESPIKNHVINQLAFSRLHSIPLSTIFGNLPAELRGESSHLAFGKQAEEKKKGEETIKLTTSTLKAMMDNIPCIGEITREGKDAAGKPLESEFYYVPEMDTDQSRKHTVTGGLGKTGLRAVRKSHKQYYWKKPRF